MKKALKLYGIYAVMLLGFFILIWVMSTLNVSDGTRGFWELFYFCGILYAYLGCKARTKKKGYLFFGERLLTFLVSFIIGLVSTGISTYVLLAPLYNLANLFLPDASAMDGSTLPEILLPIGFTSSFVGLVLYSVISTSEKVDGQSDA